MQYKISAWHNVNAYKPMKIYILFVLNEFIYKSVNTI